MLGSALPRGARVVVSLPRWIGDALEVEPAVAALVEHGAALTLDADGGVRQLYRARFPELAFGEPDGARHDVAVLFRGSFRSAWRAWRAGVPRRAGLESDARGWLLTDGARPALERGAVPLGLGRARAWPRRLPRSVAAEAVELVGWLGVTVRRRRPRFEASPAARAAAEAHRGATLVNLGSRAGSAKGFPPEFAGRLVDALVARGHRVVAVCAPQEHGVAAAALARATTPVPLVEPDLVGLLALFEVARVVVTPDGGARHMAAIAGAPRVVAFAPTDPRHSVPAGGALERAFTADIACSPCHAERCPLDGAEHLACWSTLDPENLADAADSRASLRPCPPA
ncbi:MAG: glycosyltransferase family 9 protein [Planctomycetota bacterium]